MKVADLTDFFGITDAKKRQELKPEQVNVDRENLGPQKILLEWYGVPKTSTATLNPRYKKTFLIIGGVVVFMLVLMKEFYLILVVASLYFVSYIMSKNPLEKLKYTISTYGLSINDKLYYWNEVERFFFSNHYSENEEHLAVDLKEGFPSRLIIGFDQKDKEKIINALKTYVAYLEEEPLTLIDKAYKTILDKFDLSKDK